MIELSHEIEHGMVTYQGLDAPVICDYWTREESKALYEDESTFQIGKIDMVANTGTYLDVPFHRFEDGKDFTAITLEQLAHLEGILVKIEDKTVKSIDKHYFEGLDLAGKAVLVYTDWSRFWRTDAYFSNHPYLTEEAAMYLKNQGVQLVGIDSYNIDNTSVYKRPVHTILLGAEILIVEHLTNLAQIPACTPFYFYATPPKIKGLGSFPVRAFAVLNHDMSN